jgi:two-component system, LytTR family, response regulator
MTKMAEILPVSMFQRIHRSYIIALNKVEKSSKHDVVVSGTTLPIGKAYVK